MPDSLNDLQYEHFLEQKTAVTPKDGEVILSYNAAGDVVKIEKTIGDNTYTKTLSNADETIVSTKIISSWE
jgi:hypothetical protein